MENYYEHYNRIFGSFPDCVGIKELQEMLQIKSTKAYQLIKEKKIKAKKLGKDYKILKINVIAFLIDDGEAA